MILIIILFICLLYLLSNMNKTEGYYSVSQFHPVPFYPRFNTDQLQPIQNPPENIGHFYHAYDYYYQPHNKCPQCIVTNGKK